MKIKNIGLLLLLAFVGAFASSCSDNESYAELLADERVATNLYLSQYKVINEVPADTIFETGPDAPYYRLDETGNVYMQVLSNTGLDARPSYNDVIYFRYMRFGIIAWCENDGDVTEAGNANDMSNPSTYFLYGNYTVDSSSQYGQGLQMPLQFVGVGSEVNLVIKSQYGISDEISDVRPMRWHIRYYKSKL